MPPRKQTHQPTQSQFTDEERTRYLYKTVDEMRAINDRADLRYRQQMPEHDMETLAATEAAQ